MRVLLRRLALPYYICVPCIKTSVLPICRKKPAEETAGFFVRFMVRAQTL